MKRALLINSMDNLAVVLEDIAEGDKVSIVSSEGKIVKNIEARQAIPFRHKIATQDIMLSTGVIKYGEVIGRAKQKISEGEHVHIHNVSEEGGR